MIKDVSVKDITPVIEELILSGTDVRLCVTGNSMFPMLRSRQDSVIITKAPDRLKKYDLPLYRRQNGEYILHRIVKEKNGEYFMNGDNQYTVEYGIDRDAIIGIVSAFYRKGKRIEVSSSLYRLYCMLWVAARPFRGIVIRVYLSTVVKIKRRKK